MSQLDLFIQQVKEFLGIPSEPVPIRIERDDDTDSRNWSRDEKRYK